eukprot:TRINITY_DN6720_c0_g1_i2.p1 TRINITY_DN6720_c0_g1~~TRINITY_DN6720_c0_g1_i2.p1  ORF type:complete len:209 (+),score=4.10 TRINITY_DN6720_c0_g1_i2:157-783(+)
MIRSICLILFLVVMCTPGGHCDSVNDLPDHLKYFMDNNKNPAGNIINERVQALYNFRLAFINSSKRITNYEAQIPSHEKEINRISQLLLIGRLKPGSVSPDAELRLKQLRDEHNKALQTLQFNLDRERNFMKSIADDYRKTDAQLSEHLAKVLATAGSRVFKTLEVPILFFHIWEKLPIELVSRLNIGPEIITETDYQALRELYARIK